MKNEITWSAEEAEKIMDLIMNGKSKQEAYAIVLIEKEQEIVSILIKTERSSLEAKALVEEQISVVNKMIEIFGKTNVTAYRLAGKKAKVEALVNNQVKGNYFKLKRSAGCYGIER